MEQISLEMGGCPCCCKIVLPNKTLVYLMLQPFQYSALHGLRAPQRWDEVPKGAEMLGGMRGCRTWHISRIRNETITGPCSSPTGYSGNYIGNFWMLLSTPSGIVLS